jgi:hypothetical protein
MLTRNHLCVPAQRRADFFNQAEELLSDGR